MMWRGAKGLLEIDGSCQWLKCGQRGEEEEGEMRKRMKNCFLVKDARLPHSLAGGQGLPNSGVGWQSYQAFVQGQ